MKREISIAGLSLVVGALGGSLVNTGGNVEASKPLPIEIRFTADGRIRAELETLLKRSVLPAADIEVGVLGAAGLKDIDRVKCKWVDSGHKKRDIQCRAALTLYRQRGRGK